MAKLVVAGNELVVQMSVWERAAALRGDVRVPLEAVRSVRVEPHWDAVPTVLVKLDPPSQFAQLLISVSDAKAAVASVRGATGI